MDVEEPSKQASKQAGRVVASKNMKLLQYIITHPHTQCFSPLSYKDMMYRIFSLGIQI
jgi:hypothetical protein